MIFTNEQTMSDQVWKLPYQESERMENYRSQGFVEIESYQILSVVAVLIHPSITKKKQIIL